MMAIFVVLQFVWSSRPNINLGDKYEWMLRNRDARKYVFPDKNTTLLQPQQPKCHKQISLLIIVPSSPKNGEMRQAIRDTWGHMESNSTTRLLFFLGYNKDLEHQRILDSVLSEAQKYNDIVIEDFVDAYVNLTLKTIFMLKWTVKHCGSVPFILKADDDMLVNVHRVQHELLERFDSSKSLILGHIQENAIPYREKSSKWYLPRVFYEKNIIPTFASGTGYVITQKALGEVYSGALDTPLIPLEDVFLTGLVANTKLGIPLISLEGFHNKRPVASEHPCLFYPHLILHEIKPEQMRRIWSGLRKLKLEDCNTVLAKILISLFGIGNPGITASYVW